MDSMTIKLIPTHGDRVFVKCVTMQTPEGEKPKITTSVQLLDNLSDASAFIQARQKEFKKVEVWDYTGEYHAPKKS